MTFFDNQNDDFCAYKIKYLNRKGKGCRRLPHDSIFFRRPLAVVEKIGAARFPTVLAAVFDLFGAQGEFFLLLPAALFARQRRRAARPPVIFDGDDQQNERAESG